MNDPPPDPELTLDPEDWSAFAATAHRMLDVMLRHLATLRDRPAWQPMPDEVRRAFEGPAPMRGEGIEAAFDAFARTILPYPNGNVGPRFWGWVQGNGTPVGMMAALLAAGVNPHMAGFDQAPALVEHQVLRWLAELMGIPGASGLLVGGGSEANLIGLTVARNEKAGFDFRRHGFTGAPGARMTLYGSSETHGWVRKAAELLGLGGEAFREIPAGESCRLDPAALRERIQADRSDGMRPFCVVATAGTVNTGATDDLPALADLCAEEGLWLHVDGAFGALARLAPSLAPRVNGIERADSLAFDLHKWGYLPFGIACALVRDPQAQRRTFSIEAPYLARSTRGVIAGGLPFADRGMELTRDFKALKIWMALKAHGVEALGRLIEQNVRQAEWLGGRVSAHPELELLAPVTLNVVCFRYRGAPPLPEERAGAVNEEVLLRIQERGIAVPSGTRLRGRYALRVANVNHRSRLEDFEALVEAVVAIGRQVTEEGTPAPDRGAGPAGAAR